MAAPLIDGIINELLVATGDCPMMITKTLSSVKNDKCVQNAIST